MLKTGQKLGKYRILKRLGVGGFAEVYKAVDTVEGIKVALKIPFLGTPESVDDFKQEIRIAATLEHPHILPIKNADVIDGRFIIATPLGDETLGDRLRRRLSIHTALSGCDARPVPSTRRPARTMTWPVSLPIDNSPLKSMWPH